MQNHAFESRWAFLEQSDLAQEPDVPCRMYLAAAREALGSLLPLYHIQHSVGQGFQPLAGLGPQLGDDMRISLKAIGKGNRSKGFLFSNSFLLGNERGN